jgi:hypothetical protein
MVICISAKPLADGNSEEAERRETHLEPFGDIGIDGFYVV